MEYAEYLAPFQKKARVVLNFKNYKLYQDKTKETQFYKVLNQDQDWQNQTPKDLSVDIPLSDLPAVKEMISEANRKTNTEDNKKGIRNFINSLYVDFP